MRPPSLSFVKRFPLLGTKGALTHAVDVLKTYSSTPDILVGCDLFIRLYFLFQRSDMESISVKINHARPEDGECLTQKVNCLCVESQEPHEHLGLSQRQIGKGRAGLWASPRVVLNPKPRSGAGMPRVGGGASTPGLRTEVSWRCCHRGGPGQASL